MTNNEIAEEIHGISESAVKNILRDLFHVLQVTRREEAAGVYVTELTPEQRESWFATKLVQQYLLGVPLLSQREKEVVELLGSRPGISSEEMAEALFIGVNTVKTHLVRLWPKLVHDDGVARPRVRITAAYNLVGGRIGIPQVPRPTPRPSLADL